MDGHAAGFDAVYRTSGNGVSVFADFILAAVAIFLDVVGNYGASILQMDRVRPCRRQGEHEHHSEQGRDTKPH